MAKTRCFAYNEDGIRCTKSGGHASNHAASVEWTDDECFEVFKTYTTKLPRHENSGATTILPSGNELRPSQAEPEQSKCIACGHNHRGGVCKCECYQHIG